MGRTSSETPNQNIHSPRLIHPQRNRPGHRRIDPGPPQPRSTDSRYIAHPEPIQRPCCIFRIVKIEPCLPARQSDRTIGLLLETTNAVAVRTRGLVVIPYKSIKPSRNPFAQEGVIAIPTCHHQQALSKLWEAHVWKMGFIRSCLSGGVLQGSLFSIRVSLEP